VVGSPVTDGCDKVEGTHVVGAYADAGVRLGGVSGDLLGKDATQRNGARVHEQEAGCLSFSNASLSRAEVFLEEGRRTFVQEDAEAPLNVAFSTVAVARGSVFD